MSYTLTRRTGLGLATLSLAALSFAAAPGAHAQTTLVDRYSFNDTGAVVLDSVGGQNGTLQNGATESGGSLITDGTGGGQGTQYANLGATYKLPTGAATFEQFFTPSATQGAFATLFSFSQDTGNNYLIGTVQRGGDGNPGVEDKTGGKVGSTLQPGAFLSGSLNLFTVVYDGTNATAYLNNANGSFSATRADSFLPGQEGLTTAVNGIGGGAPFNDNGLTGTTQEFRIYSGALTQAQVAANFAAGPDALPSAAPEPAQTAALGFAVLGMLGLLWKAKKRSASELAA